MEFIPLIAIAFSVYRLQIIVNPPYNTGNENWVYNDNVNDPHIREWLGKVVGAEGDDLSRDDKWLCMMYPRLKLLQKLLSEDGAILMICIREARMERDSPT